MKAKKILSTLLATALCASSMSMVFANENVKLPVADTTKLDVQQIKVADGEMTLAMGMNFKATETAEEVDGKSYEDYTVDFKLVFNQDIEAGDIALAGYYGEYCDKYNDGNWVVFPYAEAIPENTAISVMDAFADSGVVDLDTTVITYSDVVTYIKDFSCGIVFADGAVYKDLQVIIELWVSDEEGNNYIVNSEEFAYNELPTADFEDISGIDVTVEGVDYVLDAGAKFTATEEDADGKFYENYVADFVLSFNKDVAAEDVMLVGQYGTYDWTKLPTTGFKANEEVGLIANLGIGEVTYADVLTLVKEFNCGVISDVEGLDATLKLNLYDEAGNAYTVEERTFEVKAEALPTADFEDISGIDVTVDGVDYVLNAGAKFTATEEDATGKFYENYKADFVVTTDKDVAAEDITLVGNYGELGWVAFPATAFEAGVPVGVMEKYDATFTYADVLAFVKEFSCGVITNEDVNITVELVLYDEDDNAYVIASQEYAVDAVNWVKEAVSGSNETYGGIIRFLFNAITNNTVEACGVKFSKAADITETVNSATCEQEGNIKTFAGDIYGIADDATYYALGYVKVGGEYFWTDAPVAATVDYSNVVAYDVK